MVRRFGNVLGAFADGAILFPLMAALSVSSGFSSFTLYLSAGLLYLISGFYFRIPMPVQPLKAIAIAAVVAGATAMEVRWAGAIVGLLCLGLLTFRLDRWADRVPAVLVHGIQAGLGLLLLRRAVEMGWGVIPHLSSRGPLSVLGAGVLCWLVSRVSGLSALGLLAAGGAMFGLASGVPGPVHSPMVALPLRWEMILALALPQVVLTGANSVLATRDVARRYFGDRAGKVTISALLASIGLGNLASSLVGGLPFCHGSGGMTAHVRGGSYHWSSNLFIGGFLVLMAGAQILLGRTQLIYPPLLLAILLGVVGYYHVLLAAPSWSLKKFRPVLLTMGLVAFVSQNLLWALVGGVLVKGVPYLLSLRKVAA